MRLKEVLKADFQAATHSNNCAGWIDLFKTYLISYSFRIVCKFRLAQMFRRFGKAGRLISWLLYWANIRSGVDISMKAIIGPGLRLAHPLGITIGGSVVIGKYAHILQNVTVGGNIGKRMVDKEGREQVMPIVGDFVLVGAGAVIAGPIKLGDYVQVGANAVVIRDVPNYAVVVGVPGKIIAQLDGPHNLGLAGVICAREKKCQEN
jgi:serine O-acetyltransferase